MAREDRLETHRITNNLDIKANQDSEGKLTPGATLSNRYLIQGVIGVGGMGSVYRARDLHFPNVVKLVAVKEMINQARDPMVRQTIVRNFEREANLLATLSHPAIPRIYDYFTHNDRSYLILEFINGKDLEALLNDTQGYFQEEKVISWAIELCDVLHHLHTHQPEPIIFRDMKPSNVMLNQHDHIVLVDFGIAKPFQSGEKGTMIGTEGYSPPEQYRGEASALADIYALGATLHHLLSRSDPRLEAPFSFSERPLRELNPMISTELDAVLNKALKYEPEERFESAEEMKQALINAARKTGALSKIPLTTTGLETTGGIKPVWTFKCEDELRGTPTFHKGSLYIGSYDNNLYAVNADTGDFIWKYPAEGGIVSKPAVADGNVYFGSEDRRLHVVSARTGQTIWTYHTEGPIRSSPHVAEGHVFIGSDDAYLHAINMNSGRLVWRADGSTPIRSTPLVSHEAIYFGTEGGEFFCLDYRGEIRWRFKAKRAITSSPVIADNVIYFGSLDSTLYALDAKTGWVIWRYRLGRGTISTPFILEDFVFTGSVDGNIYCIEAHSAREIWRFSTEHQVTSSPIVHGDSLYCGSVDGNLYCLEYRTGRFRWKFRTDGPITGTPVVHNNVIYIGSTDHRLYAIPA